MNGLSLDLRGDGRQVVEVRCHSGDLLGGRNGTGCLGWLTLLVLVVHLYILLDIGLCHVDGAAPDRLHVGNNPSDVVMERIVRKILVPV